MKSVAHWLFLVLARCVLLPFPMAGQTNGPEARIRPAPELAQTPGKAAQMDVSLVSLNITFTDANDRLVTGLEKENFRVFEDRRKRGVTTFSGEDLPISIGIIFDTSGSMSDKIDRARQAAVQFLKTANPRDEFFMVSFNDRAELTGGFTSSVDELQNRMVFTAARGQTALLDAIYLGLSQMRRAKNAKRALLVISDGGDNHSRYNERDIRNFVKEADCRLYVMGVFDINDMQRTDEERYGPTMLSELAEMTGGRLFTVDDSPDIAAKIGTGLGNQ